MEQNNTLKHYLIIGLIISFCILFNSCERDYRTPVLREFYFVNETNYTITSEAGVGIFNVGPKSTTVFKEERISEKKKPLISNSESPLKHFSSEINIRFNNVKCLLNVKENDVNSIRDIKNFVAEKVNDNTFKLTYTFTEADYNRAVTCP